MATPSPPWTPDDPAHRTPNAHSATRPVPPRSTSRRDCGGRQPCWASPGLPPSATGCHTPRADPCLPPPRAHQRVAPSHFEEGLEPGRREPQPQLSHGISPILHRPKCRPFSGVGSGEPSGAFSERQHLSRLQNGQFRVQPRLPIGGQGRLLGRGCIPRNPGQPLRIDHFHELATVIGSMPHHLRQSQRRRWRIERRATDGAPPFRPNSGLRVHSNSAPMDSSLRMQRGTQPHIARFGPRPDPPPTGSTLLKQNRPIGPTAADIGPSPDWRAIAPWSPSPSNPECTHVR